MSTYSLLAGLRILEFSSFAPDAVGGQLADLGAEVIKVESAEGDALRRAGAVGIGGEAGPGLMFLRYNRGKRSIVLDLKQAEGIDAFCDLAAQSDVVIEGARSGTLSGFGATPERLRSRNPALVFLSVSGVGSGGTYDALPTSGPWFDMYAGLLRADTWTPQGANQPGTAQVAMYSLGPYGAMAVLAGVFNARATGEGVDIEIAAIDIAASWNPAGLDSVLNSKNLNRRPSTLPDGSLVIWPRVHPYKTKDDNYFFLAASTDKFWGNFCRGIGRFDLLAITLSAEEPAIADSLHADLGLIFQTRSRSEWTDFFLQRNVEGGPVNSYADLMSDPHFLSRDSTYAVICPGLGELRLCATPVRLPGQRFSPPLPPGVGDDTRSVLRDVALYADDEIEALASAAERFERAAGLEEDIV